MPLRNCRKVTGSDTLKRAWVRPNSYLNGQQARSIEFKHVLVGEVVASAQCYFVVILLVEYAGGGPLLFSWRFSSSSVKQ